VNVASEMGHRDERDAAEAGLNWARRAASGHSLLGLTLAQQIWEPRDVHGDPPRLVRDDPEVDCG
jgi:hypothetical protein